MSLTIEPCEPHLWHKNKCSGCDSQTFDTFLFSVAGSHKYLCSECRKEHPEEDVTPLLGKVDCVLKHPRWATWGRACCSVNVLAKEDATFTAGVYKYNGCAPSKEPLSGYKIQTKLYKKVEKSPFPHEPLDTFCSKTRELVKEYTMRPPEKDCTRGKMLFKIQCEKVLDHGVVAFGVQFEGAMHYSHSYLLLSTTI